MHWARGSAWRHALLNGVSFAAIMTVLYRFESGSWTTAVLTGLLSGVIFGAISGPIQARQQRQALEAAGDLDPDTQRRVSRAAGRGRVPSDAEVRAGAARLAAYRREEVERHRWWTTAVFVAFAALGAWIAATDQPWMWLGVAFFVLAAVGQQWLPRHYRRREALLTSTAGHGGDTEGPTS